MARKITRPKHLLLDASQLDTIVGDYMSAGWNMPMYFPASDGKVLVVFTHYEPFMPEDADAE